MKIAFLICLCILLSVVSVQAERQFLEVVTLKDGSVLRGLVLEFVPEHLVILETRPDESCTLELADVLSIEKSSDPEDLVEIDYIDVLYLLDGVIFHGMIVKRIPGRVLTLELKNGSLLSLDENEVWKMVRQRIMVAGVPVHDRERLESARLELRIELVEQRIRESRNTAAQDNLEQEIARLKEELPGKGELDPQELEELKLIGTALRQKIDQLVKLAGQPTGGEEISLLPGADDAVRSDLQMLVDSQNWQRGSKRDLMEELASELSDDQREELYEKHRKGNPKKAMYINALSLVGAGSLIQRNYRGALVQNSLLLGGLVLFASGFEIVPEPARTYGVGIRLNVFAYVGIGLAAASYIYSLIEPSCFARRYNQELASSLGIEGQGEP